MADIDFSLSVNFIDLFQTFILIMDFNSRDSLGLILFSFDLSLFVFVSTKISLSDLFKHFKLQNFDQEINLH